MIKHGRSGDGRDYYLDVKSAEFPESQPMQLWIKMTGKKGSKTLAYEINCRTRLIDNTSMVAYDPSGTVMNTSELSGGWQSIVPDSIGEQLYNGACSAAP